MIWKMGGIIRFFSYVGIYFSHNQIRRNYTKTHLVWFVHIRIGFEWVWLFVTDQLSPNRMIKRLNNVLPIPLMTIECECVNAFMLIGVSLDSEIELISHKMHNFQPGFSALGNIPLLSPPNILLFIQKERKSWWRTYI